MERPDIDYLRIAVENKFGRGVKSPKDFESLAETLEERTGKSLSISTLKRFWGYMSLHPSPRQETLNILAAYLGKESFKAFQDELNETSAFISENTLKSSELPEGEVITLCWLPDRRVQLLHRGGGRFTVKNSGTSKLQEGDEFTAPEFAIGHPLYISGLLRDGKALPEYVAGRTNGLTSIQRQGITV